MAEDAQSLIHAGNQALAAGQWEVARDRFEEALAAGEPAEAHFGLGEALWWLGDMGGTLSHFERAYAAFRRRSEPEPAARAALTIALFCSSYQGNDSVAAGWVGRGLRLIESHDLDALRGELALMQGYTAGDAVASEGWAREALERAQGLGDRDLELCALSWLGRSLVRQGRIEKGLELLGEAMAGCLGGEAGRLDTVVFSSCNMMVSCARCAAFERAVEWVRAAERFAQRYGCPFLWTECRTVYGSVLMATGDWEGAERELRSAIDQARDTVPVYYADAIATLAELRVAQGRVEEAERLLAGLEGHPSAVPVLAQIHLLEGRAVVAASLVERRLSEIGEEQLESVALLEVLGRSEIALGDAETARRRGSAMARLGAERGCELAAARGERLQGHALATADPRRARRHLGTALTRFVTLSMPLEVARTHLLLAEAVAETQPEVAVAEARAALTACERLGAAREANAAAALLRRLGVKAARAGPKGLEPLTRREREVLAKLGEGLSNPEIAQQLYISRKTVEHHVSQILGKLGLASRTAAAAEAVRRLGSDSATK